MLEGHETDPFGSVLALRFMAAAHRLVLRGEAPALARHYASAGGDAAAGDAWPDFRAVMADHAAELRELIDLPMQTNEVGRSAALLGGFLHAARATAAEWLERRLAELRPGVATVVFQSLVLQYLDDEQRTRVRAAIEAAGAAATARAPLAWLRMEPGGGLAEVRLRTWPGGEDALIARAGYHGRPVHWLGV